MLLVSSVFLTLWVVLDGASLVWTRSSFFLLVLAGVSSLIGYLFLYWAFARGAVSLAAPIAGRYPAMVVLIAVVLGSRPGALQWIGTAVTLAGVIVVARGDTPGAAGDEPPDARAGRSRTVAGASVAALAWAFMISATQEVAPVVGSLQTIWLPRIVALVLRSTPRPPARTPRSPRWLPPLTTWSPFCWAGPC